MWRPTLWDGNRRNIRPVFGVAFGAALWHALTHGPAVSKSRQSAHAPRRNCAVYENVNFHQCSRPFRSGSVVCGFGWRTHRHTKHHCAAAAAAVRRHFCAFGCGPDNGIRRERPAQRGSTRRVCHWIPDWSGACEMRWTTNAGACRAPA